MDRSLKGQLLIASPKLRDPNFSRAVILMVQHDAENALGVVLNRPMDITVQSAWEQLSLEPCDLSGQLHQGGPCEAVLVAVHTQPRASDIEIVEGVYFSSTKQSIEKVVINDEDESPARHVKLFVGYAGWASGQLEREIAEGSWITTSATSERVFDATEGSWSQLFRVAGRESLSQWIDPRRVPEDPSVN